MKARRIRLAYQFDRASQALLEAIVPPGSRVRLETDIEPRDKYGRLLAYLYWHDGRMVNRLMVRQGFAVPYVLAPNIGHEASIRAAADSARQRELNLWAVEAFECEPAGGVASSGGSSYRVLEARRSATSSGWGGSGLQWGRNRVAT